MYRSITVRSHAVWLERSLTGLRGLPYRFNKVRDSRDGQLRRRGVRFSLDRPFLPLCRVDWKMAAKSGGGPEAGAGAESSQAPTTDLRLEFLSHVIQKSLRLKADRWVKVLTVDEYRKMILEFLDNPEPPMIIFTQSGPGILAVCNAPLNSPSHPAVTVSFHPARD